LLQIVIKEKISKFWFSLKTKIWFETWIIVGSRTDNHIDFLTTSMHVVSDYRKFKCIYENLRGKERNLKMKEQKEWRALEREDLEMFIFLMVGNPSVNVFVRGFKIRELKYFFRLIEEMTSH
jgi:hypothetical protein